MKTKTLFSPNLTLEEAKELIKNGADVNEQGPESRSTPIFYVDNIEVAKLLIKHGADASYQNIYKATPLFNFRSLEMALLLLNNGANINAAIPTYGNLTMLRFVESNGQINFDELKILIAHGAIFDTKNKYEEFHDLFSTEQQKAFDSFLLLTNNDDDFFNMCLAYQEDVKNNVKIDIKEMDIL